MNNFESSSSTRWHGLRHALAVLTAALFMLPVAAQAVDTLCAKVKIEISQQLTMERQGFDAMMKINNGLTTTSLDSVSVNVNFKDDLGNSVRASSDPADTTAAFFIRTDTMTGITNVSGTGVVAPATTAEIHWLIIPAPGSGGIVPTGKLYYVGASLSYSIAGKAEQVDVAPAFIYVQPMPLLTLDYFMTKDVWGDDPLTLAVEPSEPYTLGVRVKNNGYATATKVKIDSAQPKIVDNQQGLLIDFQIIGSYLNDQPAISSLLIPFGDIPPTGAANGRWIMTSSLAGHFADFSVTFTHADALGGALTSLIQATNPHYLIRDVKVDMPGRDNIRDFLALDGTVLRVYESSGLDTLVSDRSSTSVLTAGGTNASGAALFSLMTPATAGPMYVQLPDPFGGTMSLGTITRSDGKTLLPENVWLSKKRDANNVLQHYFNLFDTDTTGIYNTAFTNTVIVAHPPVIQLVPDSTVTEGNQLAFQVISTDPDGTAPLLSASSLLPVGATFTTAVGANNVVTGSFSWKPVKGQAGKYPITFSSTDGVLKVATSTNITVTTPIVPAGPDEPLIAAPQVGTEVNVLSPSLQVAPSSNPLDTAISYHFQVYSDAGMQNLVAEKLILPRAAAGNTIWALPVSLADNANYYWRVRASDGTTFGAWAVGRFFVNTVNDAPTAPLIATPANGTTVAVTTPVLSVTNSTDPEGDVVVYGFEVFGDSLLTQKVAEVTNLPAGSPDIINGGSTSWTVTPALSNTTLYFWRASATDIHGAKTVSATGNFLVDTTKPSPGAPALVAPSPGGVVTTASVNLTVANSLRPSGMALSYFFEMDRSQTFATTDLIRSGAVTEGAANTVFSVTGLVEDAHYFWRVKSSDGLTDSPWTYGSFMVDMVNDPPSVPGANNPGNGAWVTTTRPLFTMDPSVDPEGDAIAYHIEIYSDAALTTKVIDRLTSNVSWLTDVLLTNETQYFWHVRAEDMRGGLSAWSPTATFLVRTGSSASMLPDLALTSPSNVVNVPAISVTTPSASVNVTWEIDDPTNNSTVGLYYSMDRVSTSGTRIIDGLPQDPSSRVGSYSWDVSSLAPGTYYIYALVGNTAGTVTRYAPGEFVVPVPAPRGVITVTPLTLLETTEAGGQASFSVVLGNSPKADVTIGLASTMPTEGLVSPQQLVFNTANWNLPQVVVVTGQPDCINDGDVHYQVVTAKAVSIDVDYNGIKAADLALINRGSLVGCPANIPPVASAGPAQKVDAGSTVALNGSGTDSDGTVVSYAWVQTAGPTVVLADATKAMTSFVAPLPRADTQLTFQLTVTDNLGATGTASVNVVVKASPNQPPTANAGPAQSVVSGSSVKLAGTGTDVDGTVVSYLWTQIAGPQVSLTTANTANAGFVAPTVTASTACGFTLTVTDNLGATGSSTVVITVVPNQPPVANAGANQIVKESSAVTLTGSGTDADGTVVSYLWAQTSGPSVVLTSANAAVATFTSPVAPVDTILTFSLTVTDNLGATGTASTSVTVTHSNIPPTANAGANQTVNESTAVTLAGSGKDVDGTIASYAWTQTAGPTVVLSGITTATASFTAPAAAVDTILTFTLTVTDNLGATGSATTTVTVKHVNIPPTANAGAAQTVNESTPVTLAGSGTDVDGTIASYAWTQTAGPTVVLTGATTATASFTAPATMVDAILTFKLTVTDNLGATGSASTNVTVKHVNIPPVANAGIAQTVNESSVVALNGSGTDIDGTVVSYAWTQTAGTAVTLSNANAATASFIAPATMVDAILTFKLTVTDNLGATGSATTTVTVKHVNIPPTANAGVAQTVNEKTAVTLTGSGTDVDGTIASYAWIQTAGPTVTLTNATTAIATFTAPAALVNTVLTFQLTVTDNLGATGAATTNVTVQHINIPPTANAGVAQTVNEKTAVTLTGSGTDVDGTVASYAWTQTAGPTVTLTNANAAVATFTAPAALVTTVLTFQLTVTDNLGATGTSSVNVTVQHVNVPPTANAGVAQTVNQGVAVTLTGSGTDTDGTIASYAWTQTAGPTVTLTNASAAVATFTAPVVTASTVLTFKLTVTDNLGATGTATVNVTVNALIPPTVNAGANQSVANASAVTLAGSATAGSGTIKSYAWTQTAGTTVTLTGATTATASFTAPSVTAVTVLTFKLTVTDSLGSTGSATVNVTVNPPVPPTVSAGAAQTVASASKVTLSGTATAGSGTLKSYAWTQTAGTTVTLTGGTTLTASFTAPTVTTATVLTFKLTVTDSLGSTGSATVNVTVNPPTPPTVNAGVAQTVISASKVTLAGSATAGSGTLKSYAWTQTAGTTVTLTGATTLTASFTAPTVTVATVLTFKLTVTDSLGSTGSATVNVTVNPPTPPTVSAGAAQSVASANTVTLAGTATAGSGTLKTYAWTQTAGTTVTLTGATTLTASFTAPTVTAATVLTFKLTVTDSLGSTGSATVNVTVNPPLPPTVNAGAAQTIASANTVTLAGTATAGSGTIKSYAWTQTAGTTVTLTGATTATASFTAPTVTAATVLTFKLTVTNSAGLTGTSTVNITVNPPVAPTVSAGVAQTVISASKVTLTGTATAGSGTIKTYAWTQTAGTTVTLTGATTATVSFTAPTVTTATVLTFKLTVTNSVALTGTSTVNITVNPPVPPTVSAGAAQTVISASKVTLAGTATAGSGTLKTYAWTQTAGTTVTLTGGTTLTSSFTAPTVTVATVLTFKLTVTDSLGSTGTSTVNVTVNPPTPPTVSAGAAQTVTKGSKVTLAGTATAGSGTLKSYAWTQTAGTTVTLTGATTLTASFTAPTVTVATVFTFKLTVTDSLGSTGSATVNITVQ